MATARTNSARLAALAALSLLLPASPSYADGLSARLAYGSQTDSKVWLAAASASVSCGSIGDSSHPGFVFDITAKKVGCTRARRIVSRANDHLCDTGCTSSKTQRIAGYRCRFGPFNWARYYEPVRCARGKRLITFRVAVD